MSFLYNCYAFALLWIYLQSASADVRLLLWQRIPYVFSHSRPYAIQTPLAGIDPLTSDNTPLLIWPQSRPPLAGYIINNIGSTVCLFNFSACFSNEIQTDDAQKPVSVGTKYIVPIASGGFAPRPHQGSAPAPRWGTYVPQTSCSPVTPPATTF